MKKSLFISLITALSFSSVHSHGASKKPHTVVIESMKFSPEKLVISAGDTVVWVNKDFFPHTATAQNKAFDSGQILPEKSWKHVYSKKESIHYICTLHPTMKGEIIVRAR